MKTSIIYFSRTGETKNHAMELAKAIGAPSYELKDDKAWFGPVGIIKGLYYSAINKKMKIRLDDKAMDADHLIIMSPLWLQGPTPAVKTLLDEKPHQNVTMVLTNNLSPVDGILKKYQNRFPGIKKAYGITRKKQNAKEVMSQLIELHQAMNK